MPPEFTKDLGIQMTSNLDNLDKFKFDRTDEMWAVGNITLKKLVPSAKTNPVSLTDALGDASAVSKIVYPEGPDAFKAEAAVPKAAPTKPFTPPGTLCSRANWGGEFVVRIKAEGWVGVVGIAWGPGGDRWGRDAPCSGTRGWRWARSLTGSWT